MTSHSQREWRYAVIDVHCHILPGVDDGARSTEAAVAMAREFVADGVRIAFATSHFCHAFRVDRETVLRKLDALQAELDRLGIPLKLLPGNEVRLESTRFFYDHLENDSFAFLGGTRRFLLLEQSWDAYNPDTPAIVRELAAQGIRVILAHPERMHFFQEKPKLVEKLVEAGAWMQLNAGSLAGEHGPHAQRAALEFVKRGLVHTIGSDSHNANWRKPNLSQGYRIVERHAGPEAAEAIRSRTAEIVPAAAKR